MSKSSKNSTTSSSELLDSLNILIKGISSPNRLTKVKEINLIL